MKKKALKESFEWKVGKKFNGGGQPYYVIYIDPALSENTYEYRMKIKQMGARWDPSMKAWYFPVSRDEEKRNEQIERLVKPCVEFMKSVEKQPSNQTTDETLDKILKMIDDIIAKIDDTPVLTTTVNTAMDPKTIKDKLGNFKEELINSFSNGHWKEMMAPIIKFKQAQGPAFSFNNCVLIWIQDPEAKMVKSRYNWKEANRTIKPGAPAICLWYPHGKKLFSTEELKRAAKLEWLQKNGFIRKVGMSQQEIDAVANGLRVGEKEKLRKYLNQFDPTKDVTFTLEPNWFDVRFTEQMEDKEDLIGSIDDIESIPWYDGVSEETEQSAKLYDAVLGAIEKTGIRVTYGSEESLGGARGVSKGGNIEVIKDAPKTPGAVSTLVHEFSHEFLHQKYLKNKDEYSRFFVGTDAGRGMVEQQAEISAWIVMRNFGYDMKTAVNYAGIWGADDKTCVKVFDTVAKVATEIIKLMYKEMGVEVQYGDDENEINEGIGQAPIITGIDVAKMLGPDAVKAYMRGENQNQIMEIKKNFFETLDKINKVGKEEE